MTGKAAAARRRGHDEIEVKIPLRHPRAVRARMRRCGFRVARSRRRERNWVWDRDRRLLRRGELLRVRRSGNAWTLTYKGPRKPGALKRRRELETGIENGPGCLELLARIGFRERVRYDRFRTRYGRAGDAGEVDWDETPMGVYLELEGPAAWIRATARELGLSLEDAEQRSYPELYLAARARRGTRKRGHRTRAR